MGEVDGNVGTWGFARGGMGAVSKSIAGAFQAYGGELRTEAGVDTIIVNNGKTAGVALENGDEIHGRLVVSAMDVKRTFLNCMDEKDLPEKFHRIPTHTIGTTTSNPRGCPRLPRRPPGQDRTAGYRPGIWCQGR